MRTKREAIAERIVAQIARGRLREGDRLPSEEQLAASHAVSLGTMQKALAQLADRGLLKREHGRGTFVAGSKVAATDVKFMRFRDAAGVDLPLFVQVLGAKEVRAKGPWSKFLGGEGPWMRIDRRIEAGPRVRLAGAFYLRLAEYAALGGSDAPADNLRERLEQRLALPTTHVEQLIAFAPLPARAASILKLPTGSLGFAMELMGYTLRDRPLFYQSVHAGPFQEQLVIVR